MGYVYVHKPKEKENKFAVVLVRGIIGMASRNPGRNINPINQKKNIYL
jgi:hypothetical protein